MAYSLLQAGHQTKQNAMNSYQTLADAHEKREQVNDQLETQEKNNRISAVGSGAAIGATFGPVGAAVGAGVGLLASYF